ncbi:hypothetical protein CEUSTIGMA_g11978.t1 [Chlamydomonas eustigma]|uniref:Uncharacterized protein n=1 Tax=Chlamydomonas eustigma TaxID=1157962 RepID=A0A250XNA7_9CHLO|nr:hypothetical protein CEUSTIGMA_g11978.t1 [Chlamydomonas eustigma]|eukprot:GAX84557.1 hypothetical protein CEUSTIGMA_g11978.t1 [Chlamydomonas eustigma]
MMPLHIAAEYGQVEMVQYLMKKHIDLDAGDNFRVTPVHLAAIEGYAQVVKLLMQHNAVINAQDVEGDLPLHWAATKGHCDVIKILIEGGCKVDPLNSSKWTPLHRAAYNGRKAAAVLLVKLGASLRAKNKEGNTALHLACFMNHLGVIEQLVFAGASLEDQNLQGQTPCDLCITDGAKEIFEGFGVRPTATASQSLLTSSTANISVAAHSHSAGPAVAAVVVDMSLVSLPPAVTTYGEISYSSIDTKIPVNQDPPHVLPKTDKVNVDEDDFPEVHSPAAKRAEEAAAAAAEKPAHPSLYPSAFLREIHRDDGKLGNANPYECFLLGPNDGNRSSRALGGEVPPLSPLAGPARGVLIPANDEDEPQVASMMIDSYQDVIRVDNRRRAADLAATVSLTPSKHPMSANKKFLSKYNLANHGLFAP